ncbi:uncharacterized protein STEHIDRAFT_146756 [Stereum hirsutum FP-91666 SS1]|uniref:uncharacterized protein n=1 Tax=Stereum hirsutum (strain FP-91666) TaxID=721885 RepID=UPI000440D747|nr:uncharacterized protein STEHIDRAFT_146756 [Stereum hirsutum FP-91666 SS1]EIM87333.1 hypothetical protein STEHIDRAFT_146756 [Stereum hirsutum FP-91666 SS1]
MVKYDDIVGSGRVLEPLTPAVLRGNWVCPGCDGGRQVCGGMSIRWPNLVTYGGWSMPCPACLGFDLASEAKALWRSYGMTDDDQELVELYAQVNAFLPAHEHM